jgi:serine/threonine protein kinase
MSQKKKIDNYLVFLDKKIGQGSFGSVYIGEQDKTGLKVAVKMLDKKISFDGFIQLIRTSTSRMPY